MCGTGKGGGMTTGQASEIRAGLTRVSEALRMIDKRLADLRAEQAAGSLRLLAASGELEAARGALAGALTRLGAVECGDTGKGGRHDRG